MSRWLSGNVFSYFCGSFEEFVNYILACCFETEIKISNGWWQIWKRKKTKPGQPQYFIFDFDFLIFCLLLQKPRNQLTYRTEVFLMNRKEQVSSIFSFPLKCLNLWQINIKKKKEKKKGGVGKVLSVYPLYHEPNLRVKLKDTQLVNNLST